MKNLKPCPFCGETPEIMLKGNLCYSMVCEGCGCQGPSGGNKEKAMKAWNTRKATKGE